MQKKKSNYFLIVIPLILFIVLTVFLLTGKNTFILKKVKFSSDFDVDRDRLFNYLGVYPKKVLMNYNISDMNKKLDKLSYLKSYKVSKEYPDTLVIMLYIKKAVAKIPGENGKLFLVDETGNIFKEALNNYTENPTLIFSGNAKIKTGMSLNGKFFTMFNELALLNKKFDSLYSSISQIEVFELKNQPVVYKIYFKTSSNSVYLKNSINVDSINKGLSACLYFENKNIKNRKLYYTNNAFEIL